MTRFRGLALLLLALGGCLPEDTRPPPAELTVTVSSSPLTTGGIPSTLTADGFELDFERVLVNLGEVELGDGPVSTCNVYSNPGYTRLFDFERLDAPSKLGIAYATGDCSFAFRVRAPETTSIDAVGVSAGDDAFMRTPGSDPDTDDAGVSVYIEGRARRAGQTFHFAWPFRKRIGYTNCAGSAAPADGAATLELAGEQKTSVDLQIQAEKLFQGDPTTGFHFEPFTLADTNGDGEISFDELWNVDVQDFATSGLYVPPKSVALTAIDTDWPCFDSNHQPIFIGTLGDYAYCSLLPQLASYADGGSCNTVTGRAPTDN